MKRAASMSTRYLQHIRVTQKHCQICHFGALLRAYQVCDQPNLSSSSSSSRCNSKFLSTTAPDSTVTTTESTTNTRRNWKHFDQQKAFFESLASRLNIQQPEDWYRVSAKDVIKMGGSGLLSKYYNGSLVKALSTIYPDIDWQPWRFETAPNRFWEDRENQRKFLDWVASKLRIRHPGDWYNIKKSDVLQLGGAGLLKRHGESLKKALASAYPEVDWQPWKFSMAPVRYWGDLSNQREFLDWVTKQLGIKEPHDWYRVSAADVIKLGGAGLLNTYYNGSLIKALQALYPDVEWQPWKFDYFKTTGAAFSEEADVKQFIEALARELHIAALDDWYRISVDQIRDIGGIGIIRRNGGLYAVLRKLYPEHHWDETRFKEPRRKKSSQRWLGVALRSLYPDEEILEDYEHPEIKFSGSNEKVQLDIFIPRRSLAFEFHGKQHYKDVYFFGAQSSFKHRDDEKIAACKKAGLTLVIVPYWWDRKPASLLEMIQASLSSTSATTALS